MKIRGLLYITAAAFLALGVFGCGEEEVRQAVSEAVETTEEGTERVRSVAETVKERIESAVNPDHTVAITNFVCPIEVEGIEPEAAMIIGAVTVELKNTDDVDYPAGPGDFTLEDGNGNEYQAVTGATIQEAFNGEVTLKPGETFMGTIFFSIAEGAEVVYLVDKSAAIPVKVQLPAPAGQ